MIHINKLNIKSRIKIAYCLYRFIFSGSSYKEATMPKKCITRFEGKPCSGNYNSSNEKVSVFRFPKDPQERALWVNALPSKVNVRDESVLCEKHWPKDFQRKKCQGPLGYRPHDPP